MSVSELNLSKVIPHTDHSLEKRYVPNSDKRNPSAWEVITDEDVGNVLARQKNASSAYLETWCKKWRASTGVMAYSFDLIGALLATAPPSQPIFGQHQILLKL